MKKLTINACIMAVFMSLTLVPTQLMSETTKPILSSITADKAVDTVQVNVLLGRLEEIKTMDKSHLSASEKKQLRKETRSIKRHLSDIGGGVYLSVGAIIIIILLLVLLL
jgi:hypothetical protein